jgi:FixJ family two-component response regulator
MDAEGTVFVIDDDPDVRDGLSRLLRAVGWDVRAYATADAFLDDPPGGTDGCVLLDVSMPGMTGPELHDRMREDGNTLPVIYLTGQSTLAIGVRAMKQGARDFLEKPVDEAVLVPSIEQAISDHRLEREAQRRLDDISLRLDRLSPREREVMDQVIAGRLNKQIAGDLGIAEKTVKVHRGRMMEKMGVRTVADLVRLSAAAPP